MKLTYPSCEKVVNAESPRVKDNIRQLVCESYSSLSCSIVSSSCTTNQVIAKISLCIRKEMKNMCSDSHDSILRDSCEGIAQFSWQTIWLELTTCMPPLIKLLSTLLPDNMEGKRIICVIGSVILKKRSNKMSLLQRAISVFLLEVVVVSRYA